MNWKLIGLLSLTGVLMGVVTVYYIPTKYESVLGTPVYLLCAYVLARYAEGRYFAHGFLIGVKKKTTAAEIKMFIITPK